MFLYNVKAVFLSFQNSLVLPLKRSLTKLENTSLSEKVDLWSPHRKIPTDGILHFVDANKNQKAFLSHQRHVRCHFPLWSSWENGRGMGDCYCRKFYEECVHNKAIFNSNYAIVCIRGRRAICLSKTLRKRQYLTRSSEFFIRSSLVLLRFRQNESVFCVTNCPSVPKYA